MSDRSSNSGVIGGSADVAKVRGCLDTLGEVLGQPALRVMTQLVMAGKQGAVLCYAVLCTLHLWCLVHAVYTATMVYAHDQVLGSLVAACWSCL